MHYQAIKYFSRLSSINSGRLLHEAYNLEKEKMQIGETGFCNYVGSMMSFHKLRWHIFKTRINYPS